MNLHVIFPGDSYTPGGISTSVDLFCFDENDKRFPVKVEKVLLLITEDPFSIEEISATDEVNNFSTNVIYATKITYPCDDSVMYVAEYINDVYPFIFCCNSNETEDTNFLLHEDEFYLLDEDNGRLFLF